MVAGTYLTSGLLLLGTAVLFDRGLLTAVTIAQPLTAEGGSAEPAHSVT